MRRRLPSLRPLGLKECSRELRSRATCEIALLPYHSRIPRSTVGEYCRKDGWRIYGVFKKQGDWISYVATLRQ